MSTVLVTGATGFIGHRLVFLLLEQGVHVRCLVRPTSGTDRLRSWGAELRTGDVTDRESLDRAVEGVDIVYHLAGVTKALNRKLMTQVNELGSRYMAEGCAARTTPPVLVAVSSLAAAGPCPSSRLREESDPPSPVSVYGRSKRAGELALHAWAHQVPITVVRPPIVFGEGDTDMLAMIRPVVRFRFHAVPGFTAQRFSLIHVDDLARGLILAAKHGQRLRKASCSVVADAPSDDQTYDSTGYYFLAHDEHPTYAELGHRIARAAGMRGVLAMRFPRALTWVAGATGEITGRWRGVPTIMNLDKAREATAGSWACSPRKATSELGFTTAASLDQRLEETIQWYFQQRWL